MKRRSVTVSITGPSIRACVEELAKSIDLRAKVEAEFVAEIEALRSAHVDLQRQLASEQAGAGAVRAEAMELRRRIRVSIDLINRGLGDGDAAVLVGRLSGEVRPPVWSHQCGSAQERRVELDVDACGACGARRQ